jgi:RHS repeat-associated protein
MNAGPDCNRDGDVSDAGERVYVLQDANYNVVALIGDSDLGTAGFQPAVIERYAYDAYGTPLVLNADWTLDSDDASDVGNRYLFQGGRFDRTLGLFAFGHRDLSTSLGRWLRQDPIGYVDGPSLYQFVLSSPYTFVDPSGLKQTPGYDSPAAIKERDRKAREENKAAGYDPKMGGPGTFETMARHVVAKHRFASFALTAIDVLEAGIATDGDWGAMAQAGLGFDPWEPDLSDMAGAMASAAGPRGSAKRSSPPKGSTRPPPGCFVAGTLVLSGVGEKVNIESVKVGDRLATDGGVSNSGSLDPTPHDTQVDPKTWKKVSITVDAGWDLDGDDDLIEIETLVSPEWLARNRADVGVHVTAPLDLEELGVQADQPGLITAINPIDHLAEGPGRVVLTTITRLNSFVFDLTLTTDDGKTDSYGVTGFHKWYSESRGWVSTVDLQEGEELRTATGTVRVSTLTSLPGTDRVYNFTVEQDHVYYVGELTTLTHNNGCGNPGGPAQPNRPSGPNKMQKEVERRQAPRDVDRVDKPHAPNQQPHVH